MADPVPIGFFRVLVRLAQDDDGYPPVETESLWASDAGEGAARIENIPVYARGLAFGDVVACVLDDEGRRWVQRVVTDGGHGTIRVHTSDQAMREEVRHRFHAIGCESEWMPPLLAIDIVPSAISKLPALLAWLDECEGAGRLDYEEGAKTW